LQIKTGMEKTGATTNLAPSPASATSTKPQSSRVRAPGLSFKAKTQRERFAASALEAKVGIEFSTEGAEKLRALSGNDMGAALSIYLQGYYNISEDQSPEANKQISRVGKRQSSSESMSSINSGKKCGRQRSKAPITIW
jgi:preprotein translocase subunit SecD